ncbi:MAG: hypothetical protein GVY04_00810 [Cyanobacteria bacterium]|jgi:hypothetical protein|nr:hypothetical protein [Cyanobacteria bacterium GSL.Bin1]
MSDQNSSQPHRIRPDDLMQELGIKKDTYYADLNYLEMKASKDENGKAYLTNEQANLVRELRSHVSQTGKREGFVSSSSDDINGDLVHRQSRQEIAALSEEAEEVDLNIPQAEPGGYEENLEKLIYEAAQLKMQNLSAPHLVKLHLAQQMSEEDLPPEMREKVQQVRNAANPKFQPSSVANNLLQQWRNRGGNEKNS